MRVPAPWLRLTMMQAGSASAARTAPSALIPSKRASPLRNTMPCIRRQPGTSSSPSARIRRVVGLAPLVEQMDRREIAFAALRRRKPAEAADRDRAHREARHAPAAR